MIIKFQVAGMTCAACSARVEKVTNQVPGVERAEVNLLAGSMNVYAESDSVVDNVIKAVAAAGYAASLSGGKKQDKAPVDVELKQMKRRIVISAAFLIVLMYFTMGHMIGLPVPEWYHGTQNALTAALLQFCLTLPVVWLNSVYYQRGLKALWNRSPNMDSLIAVGSGAALVYGLIALFRMSNAFGQQHWDIVKRYSENLYFESAAMILTLITFGKYLETRAKGKTGDALRQLMDLSPNTAAVRRGDTEETLPVDQVRVGDTVIVRSGGGIPVDGTVLSGRAAVDQSALTGESTPIEKVPGDTVAAATINTDGYLEIRAEKIGEDTTLSHVIRMVEEAGYSKAPIARLADKIAGVFVPVVMVIASITLAIWLFAGYSIEFALTSSIAVLVISCPCALGLATPVAIMVATGRGAKMGVLFKNAEALENLHKIDTVVLDKTGTLTAGKPSVTDVIPGMAEKDFLLRIASALEMRSQHPFAKAIVAYMDGWNIPAADDFELLPGRGVAANVNGVRYYGGNIRLMDEIGIPVPDLSALSREGKTPLYFASEEKHYLGCIAVADILKPDSVEAVRRMHSLNLNVVMLTGDNAQTAEAVASKAGIDSVISDVLPGDKAEAIQNLRGEGKHVLMVGDGINDAPALVTADVGMAIGAGTDIAIESADVVLMKDSVSDVCDAIALSKATIRNIRQNLFWAFFYNSLGIPVAAGLLYPAFQIQLSPMLGAAFMSISSVFVVTNALRLRFFKTKETAHSSFEQDCCQEMKCNIQEVKNMEQTIKVEGMMCPHCKARVENVCKGVAGVQDAVVDLQKKQVTVVGDASFADLKKVIVEAGYEVIG